MIKYLHLLLLLTYPNLRIASEEMEITEQVCLKRMSCHQLKYFYCQATGTGTGDYSIILEANHHIADCSPHPTTQTAHFLKLHISNSLVLNGTLEEK